MTLITNAAMDSLLHRSIKWISFDTNFSLSKNITQLLITKQTLCSKTCCNDNNFCFLKNKRRKIKSK